MACKVRKISFYDEIIDSDQIVLSRFASCRRLISAKFTSMPLCIIQKLRCALANIFFIVTCWQREPKNNWYRLRSIKLFSIYVSFKQRLKRHQFAFTSGLIIINTRLNNELQQRESSRVTCLFALSIIKPLFVIHRALRRAPHGF